MTPTLILANVIVFFLQGIGGDTIIALFALWPLGGAPMPLGNDVGGFLPWQLVTYAFLHGGLMHLGLNMLALYMFGSELERLWGTSRYLRYYFACVLSAGLVQLVVATASGSFYPTVGASGAVFGLLLAFAFYFPRRIIVLIFPPIPLPAWLFVSLYALMEIYFGITSTQSGIAHFAHLGGMVGGWLMLRQFRRGNRIGRRPS